MNRIQVLPPSLVNKIAAGEVIERPAFVVKELLDNAVDAGATHITVAVINGGLSKIVVTDAGCGMEQDDLFLSWQQHTTSKLDPASDLTSISTLGFRGEALASIAAVSDLTVQSRVATNPGGHLIRVQHGKLTENTAVGMAPGTRVMVEELFAHHPARQKFLASSKTEWSHIVKVVEAYCIAHPEIQFSLSHNGKEVIAVPKQQESERIEQVLGKTVAGLFFPIALELDHGSIQGFLGKPQASFHTALPSFVIVNNRVIKHKALKQAITTAYRTLLKVEASPFYIVRVSIPVEMTDVNVHPRKEEIAILNEQEICSRLVEHIGEVAAAEDLTFRWSKPTAHTSSIAAQTVRSMVMSEREKADVLAVFQLHDTYVVLETSTGMLVIDQHAAHERVLYEKLYQAYEATARSQHQHHFSEPISLSLPPSQLSVLESYLETLHTLGFELSIDQGAVQLQAVPEFCADRDILQLLQELIRELDATGATVSVDQHTHRMLSFLACRMAIKARDSLTKEQMRALLDELQACTLPFTCPHGRPTHIEVTLQEIERKFGRR